MLRTRARSLQILSVMTAIMLSGCMEADYASVTISYQPDTREERWSLRPSTRQRIVSEFQRYTETHGYKCRAHVKRVEEITCRGPKDLNMTFKPELNKPAFVARFNWLNSEARTHDEFRNYVTLFANNISRTVDDATVRLDE